MRRIKTLIATCVIAAVALSAMAAPASAAVGGDAAIVNGIPGQRIDVCLGKTELKSGLKYGGVTRKQLSGKATLVFRKAAPGACKGKVLSKRTVKFPDGSDKTVVATKGIFSAVFDNAGAGIAASSAPDGALIFRHAALIGTSATGPKNEAYFRLTAWASPYYDGDVQPSLAVAADPFVRNDEYLGNLYVSPNQVMRVKATHAKSGTLLGKKFVDLEPLKRYEFILVGTKTSNAKLVLITTKLATPPAP